MIALIGVAVVLAFVAFAYLAWRSARRRRAAFAAWAAAHGWTYARHDDTYRDQPWGSPFGIGSGRAAFDVLTGTWQDRPALCFTYRYQTTSSNSDGGSQTTDHWFAIHALRLPRSLPTLRVGREGLFGRMARAVGIHDIEFESEQFNRAFKVKSEDRRLASDLIHPRLMQWLLDSDAPGFAVVGPDLFLVRNGRLSPTRIEPDFAYLTQVAESVPSFVWDAHGR